ncbi:MAG TPA: hypothetical protein DCS43_07005 [Verrucomicrobia bacterium]|nr:hypothetical protein [Verrucomicrobiota bacterium]
MNIVLLNDTDGRENIGCRLTSSTLKQQIRATFGSPLTPVSLSPFPWYFGKGRKTGNVWRNGLGTFLSASRSSQTDRFIAWLTQLARQEYGNDAVTATMSTDLAIFHPEGSISNYHDASRIINLLSLPLLACIHGISTFTMNGTFPIYPSHDRRYQIIQIFLRACRFVALRDRIAAGHYGVTFMPDSAIMHELSTGPAASRPYVLITTGANLSKRMNVEVAKAALRFCDDHQLKPLVLTKKHQDLKAIRADVLHRKGQFIEQATLQEAETWIAQCALHIGGRYHMALFSLLLDVPSVLMMTNTHKNRWLAEEFNGIALATTPEDIQETATSVFGKQDGQAGRMRESLQKAQSCFHQGIRQASNAATPLTLGPRPSPPHADYCQALIRQLRWTDFVQYWPFGVRIHL